MKKKKVLIISSIVFVIVVATLFVSYGYITAEISGNETSKQSVFNGQIIKVEYSDGTETLTSDKGVFTPGSTITKTFTIKNTGNVSVQYSINLDNIINTFTRKSDIIYDLSINDNILKNGIDNASGIFPDNKLAILNKDILGVGESKTYTLKINYLNSDENQIVDSGKSLSANIVIEESIININKLLVYGNSVQNGTPTPDTPVEIESVGNYDVETGKYKIPLEIKGKNIYNAETIIKLDRHTSTQTIKVKPHTNYKISVDNYTKSEPLWAVRGLNEYTENISENTVWTTGELIKSMTSTFNSGEYEYVIIRLWETMSTYGINETTKIQLEEGTEATEYEPYIEPTTINIYLIEPLRKVGDYADYIDFENGKVVRNIKEIVLNGSESWNDYNSTNEYKRYITNALDITGKSAMYSKIYSNRFKGTGIIGTLNGIKMASGAYRCEFYLDVNEFKTLNDFKNWLSINNTIINYVLEEPTEEIIDVLNIPTHKGTNIIEVCSDNGVCASNIEVEYAE